MIRLLHADVLDGLHALPDNSVHCVVTSPPYWGLRDYGTAKWTGGDPACDHRAKSIRFRRNLAQAANACDGGNRTASSRGDHEALGLPFSKMCGKCGALRTDAQLGLEPTPEEYVENMVAVFREVRRVLREDGTLWLNLGDSYAGSGKGPSNSIQGEASQIGPSAVKKRNPAQFANGQAPTQWLSIPEGLKPKDLVGIPWMVSKALQRPHLRCRGCGSVAHQDRWGRWPNGRLICPSCEKSHGADVEESGWWLRQDIVWHKRNCMPESVSDRCTKAHEYIFLLTKSARYFYDAEAVKEAVSGTAHPRGDGLNPKAKAPGANSRVHVDRDPAHVSRANRGVKANRSFSEAVTSLVSSRNLRSVWSLASQPYRGAHFATFPEELPRRCISAGTSEKGCCPKCGAPWKRVVGRKCKCGAFIAAQGKRCASCGLVRDWKIERGISSEMVADTWSTPGRAVPRKLGKSGKQGSVPPQGAAFNGWRSSCSCECRTPPTPCTILDPFSGAATTSLVADRLGRDAIGIELSGEYLKLAEDRIRGEAPLLTQLTIERVEPKVLDKTPAASRTL